MGTEGRGKRKKGRAKSAQYFFTHNSCFLWSQKVALVGAGPLKSNLDYLEVAFMGCGWKTTLKPQHALKNTLDSPV